MGIELQAALLSVSISQTKDLSICLQQTTLFDEKAS